MYPDVDNIIIVPTTKRMEIIISIQVCLISRMNFDYEENDGNKSFLANPKHKDRVSQCGKHDCSANNKKDRDYYEYLCSSYVTDKL